MQAFNDFVDKYYLVFAIASGILLLALIGYYIEKKAQDKKLVKTEELKTINIQEQVNKEVNQEQAPVETLDAQVQTAQVQNQPTQAAPQQAQQQVAPFEQQAQAAPQENTEENIEILG